MWNLFVGENRPVGRHIEVRLDYKVGDSEPQMAGAVCTPVQLVNSCDVL